VPRREKALSFTGERMTSAVDGQIAFEHFHRYCLARDICVGKDVLDVASGEGYGSALLANVARRVVGVEVDTACVVNARASYAAANLEFIAGDVQALPLPDAAFDVVVSFETVEHLRDQDAFLGEVRRVLRPGGVLLISVPDRDVYPAPGQPLNRFHVLELSCPEFDKLLGTFFAHHCIFRQRTLLGSVIASTTEADGGGRSYERRAPDMMEAMPRLSRAFYLIGVASDGPLPRFGASIYSHDGSVEEMLAAKSALRQAREEADRERMKAQAASERLALMEASTWRRLGARLCVAWRRLPWVKQHDPTVELVVDLPNIVNNDISLEIHGVLQIEGCALARDGVAAIEVSIDGLHYDNANYGHRREDVVKKYRDWENAALSGYTLQIPCRAIGPGEHLGRVTLRTRTGRTRAIEFKFSIEKQESPNEILRRKITRSEIDLTENILSGIDWKPSFGLLLGISGADDYLSLGGTLNSLRNQAYGRWHVIIASKASGVPEALLARLRGEYPDIAERIRVATDSQGSYFEDVFARACGAGQPDLIGILSAGDVLGDDALLELAVSSGLDRESEFFYADERRMSPVSGNVEAFFKPRWSPDLLLATNYIGRIWCARPALLDRIGANLDDWRHFGEYDLVLRCTEAARGIQHVPHVLCERAVAEIDDPARERGALYRAMERHRIDGEIVEGCAPGYYRLQRRPRSRGLVSIIMPTTGNAALLGKCLPGLFERTANQNFELVIIPNNTSANSETSPYLDTVARDTRVKIVDAKGPYNFSRLCNLGVAASRGEFLLFLNDDIEVVEPDWMDLLVGHAERPEVGAVGARLIYPDGKIRHAGIFFTGMTGEGRHAFRFSSQSDPGYFGLAKTARNVLAVTGACIMMRRGWFDKIGGFDERYAVVMNDVDICLRCWNNGGRVVYEPAVSLIYLESASRRTLSDASEAHDVDVFWERWGTLLAAGDPYYHPNLLHDRDDYGADKESAQLIYAGHPLFRREDIRRILAVKLDHIGDFITAVPALKRLHGHFPEAELYLLASPAIAALAKDFVPEVKEIIGFEFFHGRAELGQRELSDNDFAALSKRLAPYCFDLAVDLRKDLETRKVLRLTGARWLAGYEYGNHFPWLDISLEWEGAHKALSKRSQIGDDLSRLVEAVAAAAISERKILTLPASQGNGRSHDFVRNGRHLVCIHPSAGTDVKQWPTEYFAALIDLLVSNHDVEVVLIGTADEAGIADAVLEKTKHKHVVRSLAGEIDLTDLPSLLAKAALFVGNDSGPKHIAAGLGVPTVGIHAGTTDAHEWGPIGPNAVAVQRNMRCKPCSLSRADQCPRGLACLTELHPSVIYKVCRKMLSAGDQASLRASEPK